MAVPTITDVSPATGSAAGKNIIVVAGTNFRVPTIVYTIPMEDLVPTMEASIGGVSATVQVYSSTELRIEVPRYTGNFRSLTYPAVDIVVSNIDDDGVIIAGETATAAGAYTYERWRLGAQEKDPPLLVVAMALLDKLASEITLHTYLRTHIDFGEETVDTRAALAEIPSLNLSIDTPRDIEWSQWDNYDVEVSQLDGTIDIYRGMRTHMLVCNITALGGNVREAMQLIEAVEDFARDNPELTVDTDADVHGPGLTDSYAVEISRDASQITNVSRSSVVGYSMQLKVRGISVMSDTPIENVKTILSFIYAEQQYTDGTTLETTW